MKKLITAIDPQAYASLAGCQISSYCCHVATVDIVSGFSLFLHQINRQRVFHTEDF